MKRLAVVREGRALLYIPDPGEAVAGGRLEPAWLEVFYNPIMEFNRDLSVALVSAFLSRYWKRDEPLILDAHTGTGVRGVRYLLEAAPPDARVIMNDINGEAVALAWLNARLNRISGRIRVTVRDASSLMYSLKREEPTPVALIDLDPYGSPAPFIWAAAALAGHGSMIAATATDLAVLEGGRPRAARRKYLVDISRNPIPREIAIRTLLGFIARALAFEDKSMEVMAAYYADHYVRVYVRVLRGARRADRMIEEEIGHAYYCMKSGIVVEEGYACPEGGDYRRLGPLWLGPLASTEFLQAVREELNVKRYLATLERAESLISKLIAETSLTRGLKVYSIEGIASAVKVSMPSRRRVLERLRALGYQAVESHLSPTSFRTDAPPEEVVGVIVELSPHSRSQPAW